MFEIRDDEIDVETIMARIRDNLRKRVSGGVKLKDQGPSAGLPAESLSLSSGTVGHHMHLLRLLQDPNPQGPIASHGSRLTDQVKRFIRHILAPYHRAIFARQAEFNADLVRLIAELLQTHDKSSSDHAAMLEGFQARIETLQAEQEGQAQRAAKQANQIAEQTQALAGLTTRIETLQAEQERAAAYMRDQMGELTDSLRGQHLASDELAAKYVDLARRFEDQRQEIILQKRRLELILSELRQKIGDEGESLRKIASIRNRLMDHSYFFFENKYRLSREEIRKRQEIYVPLFKERLASGEHESGIAPSVILDVGCGRGEFIELLRENRIPAKGIDLNDDMVYFCKERGLAVEQANALDYLRSQPDDSLGGVFACQVIEHLPVNEMIEFIKLSYQKMEKGGRAVFETVNPQSLLVSATSFYLDLSHVRQVHPVALQFLAEAVGFTNTELKFLAPYPDELKLQLLNSNNPDFLKLNQNFTRLNEIVFGYQDYALICSK